MRKHRVRSRARYAAAIPAILLVALVAFLTLSPPQRVEVSGSGKAPDFTLQIIDVDGLAGRSLSLSSLNGRPVLMDFVFEWCPHCNNMAPIVERLHQKFGDKVFFLTVLGSQGTTPEKSAEFLRRHGISWTAVYDPNMKTFVDYGVRGTPTYFLIRPDGTILRKLEGEQSYETLSFAIEELLTGL